MFSGKEKKMISQKLEEILLELKHPEMPDERPSFKLHVDGKEDWSWADIEPNWTFNEENKPGGSPWNELSRIITEGGIKEEGKEPISFEKDELSNDLTFYFTEKDGTQKEVLKIKAEGFWVEGRKVEDDLSIYEAFKGWLTKSLGVFDE